tara:strand:- start:4 stop:669 length:666 start_codon:yes stop_codon:yes gene_type:complete
MKTNINLDQEFLKNLRTYRLNFNYKQREVAERAGISRVAYNRIEGLDDKLRPSPVTLERLKRIFGISTIEDREEINNYPDHELLMSILQCKSVFFFPLELQDENQKQKLLIEEFHQIILEYFSISKISETISREKQKLNLQMKLRNILLKFKLHYVSFSFYLKELSEHKELCIQLSARDKKNNKKYIKLNTFKKIIDGLDAQNENIYDEDVQDLHSYEINK